MDIEQLDTPKKALIWTIGALRQLTIWGLMAGRDMITPKGLAAWDQLDSCDRPSDFWLAVSAHGLGIEDDRVFKLLREFRDNRDHMADWVREKNG